MWSGLIPWVSVIFLPVHLSQGFSVCKICKLSFLWGVSDFRTSATVYAMLCCWALTIALFIQVPYEDRAEAVSCFAVCLFRVTFLDYMNAPYIIARTKATGNWHLGSEIQYLARKLRKAEIQAGELRLPGKYCSSWDLKLLRLAVILLFPEFVRKEVLRATVSTSLCEGHNTESFLKKTSQNNHEIFQLIF